VQLLSRSALMVILFSQTCYGWEELAELQFDSIQYRLEAFEAHNHQVSLVECAFYLTGFGFWTVLCCF